MKKDAAIFFAIFLSCIAGGYILGYGFAQLASLLESPYNDQQRVPAWTK